MQNQTDTTQRVQTERADVPEREQPAVAAREREAAAATDTRERAADARDARNMTDATDATTAARRDDVDLLPREVLSEFRAQWERVQTGFVDEPRTAVQSAHDLVDQLVERLAESFRRQRDGLEGTWSKGADVSTEDLRLALQRYRSFFDRLLTT